MTTASALREDLFDVFMSERPAIIRWPAYGAYVGLSALKAVADRGIRGGVVAVCAASVFVAHRVSVHREARL